MFVELITPLMIATTPMKVEVPASVYDHSKQTSISTSNEQVAQYVQRTFSGTRTYLPNGQPFDSDND